MRNRLRNKRLASLVALSGAALASRPGGAEGAVIYVPLNVNVGFSSGFATKATVNLTTKVGSSHPAFTLVRGPNVGSSRSITEKSIGGSIGFRPVHAASSGSQVNRVAFVSKGATALNAKTGGLTALFARTHRGSTATAHPPVRTLTSPKPFTDRYALFQFQTATRKIDYGWLELSLADPAAGPDITLIGAAYDTSGALLPAGSLGNPVPEPSSLDLELSGLAALALGAAGTRRWRAATTRRIAAAPQPPGSPGTA